MQVILSLNIWSTGLSLLLPVINEARSYFYFQICIPDLSWIRSSSRGWDEKFRCQRFRCFFWYRYARGIHTRSRALWIKSFSCCGNMFLVLKRRATAGSDLSVVSCSRAKSLITLHHSEVEPLWPALCKHYQSVCVSDAHTEAAAERVQQKQSREVKGFKTLSSLWG